MHTEYASTPTQVIETELLRVSVKDHWHREMQLWLALRTLTHGKGGRFFTDSVTPELEQLTGWSTQTVRRSMKRASEIGLVKVLGQGYVVTSRRRVVARHCVRGKAVVVIQTDWLRRKSNSFRTIAAGAVMCKDIEYRNRHPQLRRKRDGIYSGSQRKNASDAGNIFRGVEADAWCSCRGRKLCDKCAKRKKIKGLRAEIDGVIAREGIYAISLLARSLGISMTAACEMRKRAASEGFIRLEKRYDTKTFGLVPPQNVWMINKSYPEHANSWTRIRVGGITFACLRAPSKVTGMMQIRKTAVRYSRSKAEAEELGVQDRCAIPARSVCDRLGLALVEERQSGRGWVVRRDGKWAELPAYHLPGFDGHDTMLPTWKSWLRGQFKKAEDIDAAVALPIGKYLSGQNPIGVYMPLEIRFEMASVASQMGWVFLLNSEFRQFLGSSFPLKPSPLIKFSPDTLPNAIT